MKRFVYGCWALVAIACAALPAQAGWNEFWERVHVDFHRVNCFPEPFMFGDREAVRAPFVAMINNGWRRQNTLGDQHFDSETNRLNQAGTLKLREILTENPEQFRSVFVLRTAFNDTTNIRLLSVQETAAQLAPQQGPALVYQTNIAPPNSPGDYQDNIFRTPPKLPAMTTSSGSGGM